MIDVDHFIGKTVDSGDILHAPQAGCLQNLAFLVVCADTQWIRPLHPAREWLFAELSQSEIFLCHHVLVLLARRGCGRRCATLSPQGIDASPVDTE